MSVVERQEAIRAMAAGCGSPGRPSKARREDRVRFWEAIAGGVSSELTLLPWAGVSPAVGSRWFRRLVGWPSRWVRCGALSVFPASGRDHHISCAAVGVREIGRRLGRCCVDGVSCG